MWVCRCVDVCERGPGGGVEGGGEESVAELLTVMAPFPHEARGVEEGVCVCVCVEGGVGVWVFVEGGVGEGEEEGGEGFVDHQAFEGGPSAGASVLLHFFYFD